MAKSYHIKLIFIVLFIISATIFVYWNLSTQGFTNFDDRGYVVENEHVNTGLSFKNVIWAFTLSSTENKSYWHPLTWLSHMLDCQMFGLNPGMHHMVSLSLHIINALLLFIILSQMTGALWKSALVAALFALHPISVESVAWIAERKNVLSTLFWMLTMMSYIYYCKRLCVLRYLQVLIMFTLGLLAKPMLVTLPFVLLLLDYWPLRRFAVDKSIIFRLIAEKIPLLLISTVVFGIVFLCLQNNGQIVPTEKIPMWLRLSNAPVSYIKYISKTFWPTGLAIHYPFPDSLPVWQPVLAGFILAIITILVALLAKNEPYLFVGWFWFTGTLVPVSGIIQGGLWPAIALRWLYVPAIGLFIMLVWGWDRISSFLPGRYAINMVLAVIILSVLSMTSMKQLTYWQKKTALWEHTINVTSNNALAHYNLGCAFAEKNLTDQAIHQYNEAIRLKPDYEEAHTNLGNALYRKGLIKQAIYHYRIAAILKPDDAKRQTDLANAYAADGQLNKAISHYTRALKIEPGNPQVHYNLGVVYYKNNRTKEAIRHFQKALKLKPDYKQAENALNMITPPSP